MRYTKRDRNPAGATDSTPTVPKDIFEEWDAEAQTKLRRTGVECGLCGNPGASAHEEGLHNTGECLCKASRALCWREWWGRCQYDTPKIELAPCFSCNNGQVLLLCLPDRTVSYRGESDFAVPDDLAIPTCIKCGEEWPDDATLAKIDESCEEQLYYRHGLR